MQVSREVLVSALKDSTNVIEGLVLETDNLRDTINGDYNDKTDRMLIVSLYYMKSLCSGLDKKLSRIIRHGEQDGFDLSVRE